MSKEYLKEIMDAFKKVYAREEKEKLNLEIAKEIIKKNISYATSGIFNTLCIMPDEKTCIYDDGGLTILICYDWAYFEVFGLSEENFCILTDYYHALCEELENEKS